MKVIVQIMLVPRLSLSEEESRLAHDSNCTSLSSAAECQPVISTEARSQTIELPWEEDKQAFSLCLVVPRVVALGVVARRDAGSPWQLLIQMQVHSFHFLHLLCLGVFAPDSGERGSILMSVACIHDRA